MQRKLLCKRVYVSVGLSNSQTIPNQGKPFFLVESKHRRKKEDKINLPGRIKNVLLTLGQLMIMFVLGRCSSQFHFEVTKTLSGCVADVSLKALFLYFDEVPFIPIVTCVKGLENTCLLWWFFWCFLWESFGCCFPPSSPRQACSTDMKISAELFF